MNPSAGTMQRVARNASRNGPRSVSDSARALMCFAPSRRLGSQRFTRPHVARAGTRASPSRRAIQRSCIGAAFQCGA